MASSQIAGVATSLAKVDSSAPTHNGITAGQSFSVASTFAVGPFTGAFGSMGAGYLGTGHSLTYQTSVDFTLNGGSPFLISLLDSSFIGFGFDTATFEIRVNDNLFVSQFFDELISAQSFFSFDPISVVLLAGLNDVKISFSQTMSDGEGFSFDYGVLSVDSTPIPATLPLFATGLGAMGLLGWRRKRKAQAAA